MKFSEKNLLLYAITDRQCIGERDFFDAVESALKGGATMIQLREKNVSEKELIETAAKLKKICAEYNVPLIVNDNYRAALEAGADGVHVGLEDTPVSEIRKIAGDDFIIGATAKTPAQAIAAEAAGADYLGSGAVFPSPTKKDAVRITPDELRKITSSVKIPVCAIGGITRENLAMLAGCGIAGAALVSAVFAAEDIEAAAQSLRSNILTQASMRR